jgi:hypothetical protein
MNEKFWEETENLKKNQTEILERKSSISQIQLKTSTDLLLLAFQKKKE